MVDITVDAKPMPQNRVDPDVKIPDSVKRRSAAVDALYQQSQQPTSQEPSPPTAPVPAPPQPTATENPAPLTSQPSAADPDPNQLQLFETPPAPPPEKEKIVPGSEENQLDAAVGRNRALQKQIGEMQQQMEEMGRELMHYQQRPGNSGNSHQPPSPEPRYYLTQEDQKNFGDEFLDVAQRAARQAIEPELRWLREENQQLRGEMNRASKTATDQYLDANVPNWRQINSDARFHQWLLLPEPYSGIIRDRLLKDAALAANAPRVASFFKGFLAEETATGHMEPSLTPPPGKPPREAAVPLASLASPGRERPANGGIPTSLADKPTYTSADITRYHRMYMRGQIPEADYQRLSADISIASGEGRIRG